MSDEITHRLIFFDPNYERTAKLGSYGRKPNKFDHPKNLAFGSDLKLFIHDQNNYRLSVYAKNGFHVGNIGRLDKRDNLFEPVALAVNPRTRNLYASDTRNRRIRQFARRGNDLREISFSECRISCMVVDLFDNLLVLKSSGDTQIIDVLDSEGVPVASFGKEASLRSCSKIVIDQLNRVAVLDRENNRVLIYS